MSAEAIQLPGVAVTAESAGPVRFFVDRRVDLSVLSAWQRFGYSLLCRWMPADWRVPPAPTMYRGMFDLFAEADGACTSPDDQLHILPYGWALPGDSVEPDIVCRPRDRSEREQARYLLLRERYAEDAPPGNLTGKHGAELLAIAERLRRMAEHV